MHLEKQVLNLALGLILYNKQQKYDITCLCWMAQDQIRWEIVDEKVENILIIEKNSNLEFFERGFSKPFSAADVKSYFSLLFFNEKIEICCFIFCNRAERVLCWPKICLWLGLELLWGCVVSNRSRSMLLRKCLHDFEKNMTTKGTALAITTHFHM